MEDTEPFAVRDSSLEPCVPHKGAKRRAVLSKKKKPASKSFAQSIDECVWFHTLYGLLDGLSVSYSTVKFLCDVSSQTQEAYHEKLQDAFDHPSTLAIIALESVLITTIAAIGNFGFKHGNKHKIEAFLSKFWPYFRDFLKGVKNGYKGVKGIAYLLKEFGAFSDAGFRAFAIPVGLAVGVVGMINRLVRRRLYDKHKALLEEQKALIKQIRAYNEYQKKLRNLENNLEDIKREIKFFNEKEFAKKQALILKREALITQLKQLTENPPEEACLDLKKAESDYHAISKKINDFTNSHHKAFFISSVIGAIADGPYLYAGVLTLAATSGPLLISMCAVLVTMLFATILTRWQEEVERERKAKVAVLETSKELLILKCYKLFKAHQKAKETNDPNKKQVLEALEKSWSDLAKTNQRLSELNAPSLKAAAIEGIKDGLSLFGATTSIFFAASIIMVLSGSAFPPAAVAAAVFIGLVAMIGFACYRVYKARQAQSAFKAKQSEAAQTNRHWLDIVDCNTDGLTKGEFYFQQVFEVTRNLGSGAYKGDNLTNYMMSHYTEHTADGQSKESLPQIIFWTIVGGIYTLCLTLRAIGKGFGKSKKEKETKTEEFKDIELKEVPSREDEETVTPKKDAPSSFFKQDRSSSLFFKAKKPAPSFKFQESDLHLCQGLA